MKIDMVVANMHNFSGITHDWKNVEEHFGQSYRAYEWLEDLLSKLRVGEGWVKVSLKGNRFINSSYIVTYTVDLSDVPNDNQFDFEQYLKP